jgi:hypothetical protein
MHGSISHVLICAIIPAENAHRTISKSSTASKTNKKKANENLLSITHGVPMMYDFHPILHQDKELQPSWLLQFHARTYWLSSTFSSSGWLLGVVGL